MEKTKVLIVLEGGIVQNVVATNPIEFTVVDYDTPKNLDDISEWAREISPANADVYERLSDSISDSKFKLSESEIFAKNRLVEIEMERLDVPPVCTFCGGRDDAGHAFRCRPKW